MGMPAFGGPTTIEYQVAIFPSLVLITYKSQAMSRDTAQLIDRERPTHIYRYRQVGRDILGWEIGPLKRVGYAGWDSF